MTLTEFSTEFDVLYNNITSNQAPSLDDYEKSVFLTKAQDEVLKAYFNIFSNKSMAGYDGNIKRQYDFSNITRTTTLINVNSAKERISVLEKIDKRSQVFILPENFFLSINEIIFDDQNLFSVIPLQYEEYQRMMLKPYAYPVKKAAWRLISDKKNCNFVQYYLSDSQGMTTKCDYRILTSWADQQRNLSVTIKQYNSWSPTDETVHFVLSGNTIYFPVESIKNVQHAKITADCSWSGDNLTYEISLFVTIDNSDERDDENAYKVIKEGFKKLKEYLGNKLGTDESDIAKAATHLDLFIQADAPSKFRNTVTRDGMTLTTHVIHIPLVEIIGKFKGDITYQMRYIRRPLPIILTDIQDTENTICGIGKATECELPEQLHYEILQRAVELAKASYTGDLVAQVQLGQNSETNIGINQQQR